MLAMPARGTGGVWGFPGLPRNSCSSGSQVTAEELVDPAGSQGRTFLQQKGNTLQKKHLCHLFC